MKLPSAARTAGSPGAGRALRGLGDLADVLATVITAGAPPADRAAAGPAAIHGDDARRRAARWALAATGSPDVDAPAVRAAVAAGALGTTDVLAAHAGIDPARLVALPAWARDLALLLRALPADSAGDDGLWAPQRCMRQATREILRADLADLRATGRAPELTENAERDLAEQGAERVLAHCGPAVDFDLRFLGPREIDGSRGDWCRRLTALPVLGFLVGTAVRQWRAATREMLVRLAADHDLLAQGLFRQTGPAPLDRVAGDAGDPHDDGRNVAVLTFACGRRAVYKPRDLHCAAAFLQLLDETADAFPDPPPHRRPLLARDGYAWEGYVERGACSAPGELADYARHLGRLIRLATVVRARDLWQDNLRPSGALPVVLDLETVMHPLFTTGGDDPVEAVLADTVLPTGMVTAPVLLRPGGPAVDVGGCSPADRKPVPFRPEVPRLNEHGRDLGLLDGSLSWQPESMAWCGDHVADPREHTAAIAAGYREADTALARSAERLTAPGGAGHAFDGTVVRVMWSSTWTSFTTMRAAEAPQALTGYERREAVLARVLRAELAHGADPSRPVTAGRIALAAASVADLRRLDVPIFRNVVGETDVLTSTGRRVPGLLVPGGGAELRARLLRTRQGPDRAAEAVLRSCQHLVDVHTGHRRPVPPHPAHPPVGADDEVLLRLAGLLLDGAAQAAIRDAGGGTHWMGLRHEPALGITVLARDDGAPAALRRAADALARARADTGRRDSPADVDSRPSPPRRPVPGRYCALGSDALLRAGERAAAVAADDDVTAGERESARQTLREIGWEFAARAEQGSCLPDRLAPAEHQLGAGDGLPAVVLALLRAAGQPVPPVRRTPPPAEPSSPTRSTR
ncbi:type 2 lanthipeptide synthetase LanM [Streptomyces sp. NPDC021020]|uniref:type 2 lanthipeptide synthetase LanM n=1 Tax=Streptomyces sp. NPDC021020 TaxID=3365109 RepID=UPI0037B404DF